MSIELLTHTAGTTAPAPIEAFTFPGGETHLRPTGEIPADATWIADVRGAIPADLITLGLFADYAHQQGRPIAALLPYLPAARADRGEPFGAKVYAGILNGFGIDQVLCLDAHSPVMPGLVERLTVVDHAPLVREALAQDHAAYVGVIAPDKGAVARASHIAEVLGLPVFKASKVRDFESGQLSGFSCEELPDEGRLLVVDDICDGGGTFAGLAAATGLGPDRLSLWVTHGVFSGNAPQLREHYGAVLTTDSHPGHTREGVATHVVPVLPHLLSATSL